MNASMGKDFTIRLARRLSLAVIFVSLAPLLVLSGLTASYFHTVYKGNVLDHIKDQLGRHTQNIDCFLQERVADVRMVAYAAPFERLEDNESLKGLLVAMQARHGRVFKDLGLVDPDGVLRAYAGDLKLDNAQYKDAPWFKEIRLGQGQDFLISEVFTGLRGAPHFLVSVLVPHEGGAWILRATIDFDAFNRLVSALREGETGRAYILNGKGQFQTSASFELDDTALAFVKNSARAAAELSRVSNAAAEPVLPYERSAKDRVAFLEDKAGGAVYLAAPLGIRDWALVFRQNSADAFRDLYQQRNISIGVVVLGALANIGMGVLLANRIIGQMEKAEAEKGQMQAKMVEADKMASIGELVSGMAHEINNPVAVMVEEAGWVEDLLGDGLEKLPENEAEMRRALKQIRTQGLRCRDITSKLLSFARRGKPERELVRLNTLIQEVTALTAQKVRFGSIKLTLDLEESLPEVMVSLSEMQQILLNLVNNALYAMEKSGGILRLATSSAQGMVTLEVADSGPGIPADVRSRIFEPFFTTKPVGKGTGLGLSICYGIVKNMGGDITVESELGKGAAFVVRLPVASEEDMAAAGSLAPTMKG
jgi:two-component system NtrC family sensor kinase